MPETSHPLNFRKSSYSGGQTQDCVEVADAPAATAVRDSKNPEQGHLLFPGAEWATFLYDVKHGRL